MSIRVLCADDSRHILNILGRLLSSDPGIEIAGQVRTGEEAVHSARLLKPDVITLDLKMPGMGGLEALKRIRALTGIPVIVVSSFTQPGARTALKALEEGAFDFISKPASGRSEGLFEMRDSMILLIKAAYESSKNAGMLLPGPVRTGTVKTHAERRRTERFPSPRPVVEGAWRLSDDEVSCFGAVCIGCSAGGPFALAKILPLLPPSFPWPVFIVQHMPSFFTSFFAEKLNARSSLKVCEARDRERVHRGSVYLAPGDCHMKVRKIGNILKIALDAESPSVVSTRPSVDVMFHSVAESLKEKSVGILLSGMGNDGVDGMLHMKEVGAVTIVQDRDSSLIYGMPGKALDAGAARHVVGLKDIPQFIYDTVRMKARKRKKPVNASSLISPKFG